MREPTIGRQSTVVIVGTGQAGHHTAASLREYGFPGRIVMLGAEQWRPYQRPPLSKYFLTEEAAPGLELVASDYYMAHAIDLRRRAVVSSIDREARTVTLDGPTAEVVSYDHLVLAVGSRNRELPVRESDLDGVVSLRTVDDAADLRTRLRSARDVVVVGGGFVGLEVAATAANMGCSVTVVEASERLLARAVTPSVSEHIRAVHTRDGVTFELGQTVTRIDGADGAVTGVRLDDGRTLSAQIVLVGIGAVPNIELAAAAGLATGNGIYVDDKLQTSDSHISAVGDCAALPDALGPGGRIRIESVQNACDQAKFVAGNLLTPAAEGYREVPWFWSDQGDLRLQIVGLAARSTDVVVTGDNTAFSVVGFRDDTIVSVESIHRPTDHIAARRILSSSMKVTRDEYEHVAGDLRLLARRTRGERRTAVSQLGS